MGFELRGVRPGYGQLAGDAKSIRLLNIIVGSVLVLLTAPLMILTAVLIKLNDRGPLLYKGERMGMAKEPFNLFKFRTLAVGTQDKLGATILPDQSSLVTPLTKFLRDTRLDELPQLFNVLRGDMGLVGPRPVRREVYEERCQHIPNYDLRFTVPPGLMGYSQVFTPHSAPKAIRSRFDNMMIRRRWTVRWHLWLIFSTLFIEGITLLEKSWRMAQRKLARLGGGSKEDRREYERIEQPISRVEVRFLETGGEEENTCLAQGRMVDMNPLYILVQTDFHVEKQALKFVLRRKVRRRLKNRWKTSECLGEVERCWGSESEELPFYCLVRYSPQTEFQQYMIDSYFLNQSIA